MHGPDETAFTDLIFSKVEEVLKLKKNTCKIGIMDEERRTSANLKECIRTLKSREFFLLIQVFLIELVMKCIRQWKQDQ